MKTVFRSSRWRFVILLLGSLAFVVAGVIVLEAPLSDGESLSRRQLIGWASIAFFGGCSLIFARCLLDSRPRLVIDDEGVLDRTIRTGPIPWEQIQGAYLRSMSGSVFLCLHLREPRQCLDRMSKVGRMLAKANTALGFTPVSLNVSNLAADPNDILQLILDRVRERAEAGSDPDAGGNPFPPLPISPKSQHPTI